MEKNGAHKTATKKSEDFYSELGYKWLSERKSRESTEMEISYLTNILKKGWRVLDLACGYGRLTIPLASKGYEMEGIDITQDFIAKAREEAKKNNLKIILRVGNMTELPYEDSSFDAVICMWNAFSEVAEEQDQVRTIKEILRVIKKGGLAFIEVRNHRSRGLVIENEIDGFEAMASYSHTRGSLKKLMNLSGIEDFRIFIDNFGGRNRLLLEIFKL